MDMATPALSLRRRSALLLAAASIGTAGAPPALARTPALPEIRAYQPGAVPPCVTPGRLMRHVLDRTPALEPRFRDIARHYKAHGEALRVRWDYAFFQMLLETNYLSYRRGNGERGDVHPRQNNFAGIGATGGGVPGDSFPDVSTGVLAQMQHLVAYSGERVADPAAPRTREKQDDIISASLALRRPVRFSDLARRWAADRNYATSIEFVADRYRQANCTAGGEPLTPAGDDPVDRPRRPQVAALAGPPAAEPAAAPRAPACDVFAASYGGPVAMLVRAVTGATVTYTVLQVEAGLEQPQIDAFLKTHAPNGRAIARFASREQALARAFELCPAPS
jgi:hypothetical protein